MDGSGVSLAVKMIGEAKPDNHHVRFLGADDPGES
jgi:hypothetical protein